MKNMNLHTVNIAEYNTIYFDVENVAIVSYLDNIQQIACLIRKLYIEENGEANDLVNFTKERCGIDGTYLKSIEEIYSKIILNENKKHKLIEIEKSVWKTIFFQNEEIYCVYKIAERLNKKIVFWIGQQYKVDIISEVLRTLGYSKFAAVYSYESKGTSKNTIIYGKDENDVGNSKILYIGQKIYFRCKRNVDVVSYKFNELSLYRKRFNGRKQSIEESICNYIIGKLKIKHKQCHSIERDIGYEVLGPLLLGYTQMLHEDSCRKKYDKIFFLAREGKLLQRAYRLLYGEECVANEYLEVSRRAVIVPLLSKVKDYKEFEIQIRTFLRTPTLLTVSEVCNLDKELFSKELFNCGMKLSDSLDEIADKESLFQIIKRIGERKFEEQQRILKKYLNEKGMHGRVAVCDVGWYGTMQSALSQVLNTKASIDGIYMGVRTPESGSYDSLAKHGFLFDKGKNKKYDYMERFSNEVFELLMLSGEGSVKGYTYDYEKDKVKVVRYENEYHGKELDFINKVQEAACEFLNESKEILWLLKLFEISPKVAMEGYNNFAVKPTQKTINLLCDFVSFDETVKGLIPGKNLLYYICYPNKFRKDVENHCKILTLKNIFKVPFPYFQFLFIVTDVFGIKSKYKNKYY